MLESSKKIVEEHIAECELCSSMFEKIKNTTLDNSIKAEREDVIKKHKQAIKRRFAGSIIIAYLIIMYVLPVLTSMYHSFSLAKPYANALWVIVNIAIPIILILTLIGLFWKRK